MKRNLLLLICTLFAFSAYAQEGGVKGTVVSRGSRDAIGNVKVSIPSLGLETVSDKDGRFVFDGIERGDYDLKFEIQDFEPLTLKVRVDKIVKDINSVVLVPDIVRPAGGVDDAVFAELDTDVDSSGDSQSLPSSLSASKDIFNSIASYKFSEMRFNVRGYDSQYTDVYLNGIRFNDALTGYGPWSLWTGLNDATRNQENTSGLTSGDMGLGGIAGTTNILARASQMRKGFRASLSTGNAMYRLRAMVTYASGMLDNGWSYGFSFSTRQGYNGYVDGVYYNGFGYFASAEKNFGGGHNLALTVLGAPTQRGAQQASTQEAYDLFGSNYYNPNVGYQGGKLRNSRVRNTHEPIIMLNYEYQISDNTRLRAATSVRFGFNGYSALTWADGPDPRPDYYRYLPSFYGNRLQDMQDINNIIDNYGLSNEKYTDVTLETYANKMNEAAEDWTGMIDWDGLVNINRGLGSINDKYSTTMTRSSNIVEERHTDQIDYNISLAVDHVFKNNSKITGGIKARVNRTEYYDKVKDLLGGGYWLDIDKFAVRDFGSNTLAYQNDLDYYEKYGHPRLAKEGDKIGYDYYAHVRQGQLWAMYNYNVGGFTMNLGAEAGFSSMWRQGLWRKGLFPTDSYGDSKHLNYFTYKVKGSFRYQFSGAHVLEANIAHLQNAPHFRDAFVSARTRNQVMPGLDTEKVFGADITYHLRLPWIKARLSGYYTKINDQSRVISFYDDLQSSFTNFAMSGIDKRYMGIELGLTIPLGAGISLNGAVSVGDYRYTSNPKFVQIVDNSATVKVESSVNWKNYYIESTPQKAFNVGLSYRGPHNWFASVDFNYYMDTYLSMNPMYRTQYLADKLTSIYVEALGYASYDDMWGAQKQEIGTKIAKIKAEERLKDAYTLNLSVGKNWYIKYKYTLGFSFDIKNLLNNRTFRTGGYEQMRLSKFYGPNIVSDYKGDPTIARFTNYTKFDSKYFYMYGTTYYLNVYFRF